MANRIITGVIAVWTVGMAIGIVAAGLGIGRDCAGLNGGELNACLADAWTRGGIGLAILFVLWLVVFLPMAIIWSISRPRENVTVFGPAGQQVMVSEAEAKRRVEQQGWSYQPPRPA
ncbi:MAG TPA: hypothetical protein VFV72_06955 [Candidatus Limnocylindrales bacterium]|nr:hypothetical protein [Candidatus Limnocylindrales bacterium]